MARKGRAYHQPGVLRVLQSKGETRAFYDKIAQVYDLLAERSEEPVRRAGLEMLAARPGERILEIGFGTGHCLLEIARAVGNVWRFGVPASARAGRSDHLYPYFGVPIVAKGRVFVSCRDGGICVFDAAAVARGSPTPGP